MMPHDRTYFDHKQAPASEEPGPYPGVIGWADVLSFDPRRATTARVLGGQGALWTEYVTTPVDIDMRLSPRVAALSESLWSQGGSASSFASRWAAHRGLLDASQVLYYLDPPSVPTQKVFLTTHALDLRPSPLLPDAVVEVAFDGGAFSRASKPIVLDHT